MITIDCLRADHLSCFGYSRELTPCIEKFSQKGVLFTNAISNGPYTSTSFPSILTSTYALIHPRFKGRFSSGSFDFYLSNKTVTIAEVFKRFKYSTAAFHSNPWLAGHFGYNRGFDLFKDHMRKNRLRTKQKIYDFPFFRIIKNFYSQTEDLHYIVRNTNIIYERAQYINKEVLRWIKRNSHGFFLWIHYMDLHLPRYPPQSLFQRAYAVKLNRRARAQNLDSGGVRQLVKLYDKSLSYVDANFGILLESLSELGISNDNTFFIITSDHGEEFMEHGGIGHGPVSVKPKLYDELIHVPLIITGPELPEKRVDDQVALLDLAPTILKLANLSVPSTFCGKNLIPLIKSKSVKERPVISEYQYGRILGYSYRTKEWKYILTIDFEAKSELYNLSKDPTEQQNIINQYPDTVKMKTILKKHILLENDTNLKKIKSELA